MQHIWDFRRKLAEFTHFCPLRNYEYSNRAPYCHYSNLFVSSAVFWVILCTFFWLFCSTIHAVSQISSLLTPFLGPYMAYTDYLGVPNYQILYLLTLGIWFQNFVNGKHLAAVNRTKKFNKLDEISLLKPLLKPLTWIWIESKHCPF